MPYQHQKKKLSDKSNTHYRTWKKGKSWCYSFSLFAALVGGVVLASQTVNADVAESASAAAETNVADQAAPVLTSAEEKANTEMTSEVPASMDSAVADSAANLTNLVSATIAASDPTTGSTPAEENDTKSNSNTLAALSIQATTANAVSADISLLQGGSTTNELPTSGITVEGADTFNWGAKGSFTANTSDLVAGNTIVIADVSQTTPDTSGALVGFGANGSVNLSDKAGNPIGTIQYDSGLKAFTLKVTNTVTTEGDTQLYSFSSPIMLGVNFGTPISVLAKMPFSNIFSVSGKSYVVNFKKIDPSNDATTIPGDISTVQSNPSSSQVLEILRHENIPSNEVLNDLQESGGASGDVLGNAGVMKSFRLSTASDLIGMGSDFSLFLGTYYVSAATNKIQSKLDQTDAVNNSLHVPNRSTVNAGDGMTLADLQAQATKTGLYYSRQSDGSYLAVEYISPEDTVLTDEQIESNTRNNSLAATSTDIEADVQATLDYYHGVLGNRATYIQTYFGLQWADEYSSNTMTVEELNDDETVFNTMTTTSTPNQIASDSTPVKIHYVDLNGQTLTGTITKAGAPTGKDNDLGDPGSSSAVVDPMDVPGYKLVSSSNIDQLSADQKAQLEASLADLGLTLADMDDVTTKNIFATKQNTVPFPGFADTNYDADGHIVTDGGTAGYGQTDVYYFYVGNPQKVVYNIIDNNDPENPVTLDGKSNLNFDDGTSNANLNRKQSDLQTIADDYLTDHPEYAFDSIDPVPGSFDADDATNQVVNIYLKHAAVPVTGSKTVNEVIHYVYEDGSEAASDHTDQVTFTLTGATNDAVTGDTLTEGTWVATDDDNSFDAFDSPTLKGYTADQLTVDEVTGLSQDSTDTEFTVTYKANAQKVVYNVIDDTTGETLEDSADFEDGVTDGTLTKTKDDLQTIADGYVDKGYEIVTVDDVPVTFDNDDTTDQIVNIHLKHGQEVTTETREVDETIRYVYEDGSEAAPDKTDKVTFTQTTLTDKVTGEVISQTDWAAENDDTTFEAVTSPEIDGYTSDKPTVDAVTDLTADSEDTEVTVTYTKDAEDPAPATPSSTPKATISVQPTSQATKKVLPSTGDEERSTVAAAGGLIVLGAGLLSVIRYLRRKKQ
ncbi:mucin-binding protein [Lactovum odontotermitis]